MRRALLVVLLGAGPAVACPGLEVIDPWIAEAPPAASVLAGYATLRNSGKTALTLTQVSSGDFSSAMLHETIVRDGMAHMEHLDGLTLPAGSDVRLNPGGRHLMLVGPKRALKAGDRVQLRLQCGATGRDVPFTVRKDAR